MLSQIIGPSETFVGSFANSKHKLADLRFSRWGKAVFVTGVLQCLYAKTDGANELLCSGKLPNPVGDNWVYMNTASGCMAFNSSGLFVTGTANVHAADRFSYCYICS